MILRVFTSQQELINTEIDHILLPGELGQMDILPGHTKMVSTLQRGTIKYFKTGSVQELKVSEGCVEVADDVITLLQPSFSYPPHLLKEGGKGGAGDRKT